MDTTDNVWMEIFKHTIFNNHPAERLSKITSWMNNSRDAGAIATRHLEDALRLVRQSAPTAEWLGQMIDAKNSNIFIYGTLLKNLVWPCFPRLWKLPQVGSNSPPLKTT
jgi:hypothetical protein